MMEEEVHALPGHDAHALLVVAEPETAQKVCSSQMVKLTVVIQQPG